MEASFHSLVQRWFVERFQSPTPAQTQGWQSIGAGRSTLIAAPTGSGKTLAAFLWSIDRLIKRALNGGLDDRTSVVYVSPLKALGNDIARNLQAPLAEIYDLAGREGILLPTIRVAVRSGDTPARERQLMVRRPPHILITTPESLYILLTAPRSRDFLQTAETLIVDEIHAVAQDKRGAHLALSLERLDHLVGRPLQRIGLSATQKPIEEIARLLVGNRRIADDGTPNCAVVDVGHRREMELSIEVPDDELGPIIRQDIWKAVYDKLVEQIKAHRTTLVFVNTRRLVERVAHQLTERLGEGKVGAHHGSLSRKTRLEVEEKLKSGEFPVVIATASLELGIDIGHVDVVCHIGSPRNLAVLLQRVGRSGHWLGAIPKGILYPLTRDDLLQSVAAIRALRQGELDKLAVIRKPLDVLAQQMVATVASLELSAKASPERSRRDAKDAKTIGGEAGIGEEALWQLIRSAYPYKDLTREEYEQLLEMLSEGVETRRSRRSAYIHRDRIHGMLRPRRGARLTAITNGGAIPDTADYSVVEFASETLVGTVHEDFAIESLAGDIFLLGNRSWRIRRVGSGKVWVDDAQGLPPTIPFWMGEAPGRTLELSKAVSDLRIAVAARTPERSRAMQWLIDQVPMPQSAAEQIVDYVAETVSVLGTVPSQEKIIAERFFDEAGGMQLIIHSPWGGRINRAWGLALRKRFCVSFDRELQAAATDDGICISLVEQHSFPLADVFSMLRPAILEYNLTQAALAAPMFTNRWRWNASRALAIMRHSGGKKVPVALQRMRAEDLLAAVFPEQVACQDNHAGPVQIPDHPLVKETMNDCLHEAMDMDGLGEIIARIERGEIETLAVDTPAPSPMAHEILNANPYAFLDDAPLEERRARAVSLRRVDPWLAREFGRLDPAAIDEVRKQAWPEVRNTDELHDLLLGVCLLPIDVRPDWHLLAQKLIQNGRATIAAWQSPAGEHRAYVAAERSDLIRLALTSVAFTPAIELPLGFVETVASEEDAIKKIVQGWLEVSGPITVVELASRLGMPADKIEAALIALESAGVVLRGEFTAKGIAGGEVEWCDRVLLARIHRLTLGRMRREIEPVSAAEFMQFLLSWQHLTSRTRLRGRDGVLEVIRQLQGLELPAPAWEQHILPARLEHYDPADLEHVCLAGVVAWGRLRSETNGTEPLSGASIVAKRGRRLLAPARNAPLAFLLREELDAFLEDSRLPFDQIDTLSPMAVEVARYLDRYGASFLTDIARGTGLLKVKVEEALWQLVAHGIATGDGIAGLRVLLTPDHKRLERRRSLRVISGARSRERAMPVGRWSLWRDPSPDDRLSSEAVLERRARQLLERYGIVFRDLLAREMNMPPWRSLLGVYRRLEARGEIRGGRFVNGFVGEQFALSSAVEAVRERRRSASMQDSPVIVSAADPLNLVGIITPGARVSPYSNQAIAYQNGLAIDVGTLGELLSRLQHLSVSKQV
ncbi:MAG: DEAD/DEAH box helicase [Deltaproteobacteria bacterium]|nr:MAG: DEAD/DEAH box helicase [Deltaproteobacteria bacterium]